jgi:hypothetical protein
MVHQLIPQIVINYRRHNAVGLQPTMMMLWAWAGVPLGVYNIVEDFNIALQVQPQILTFLSLVTWIQCFHYEKVIHLFPYHLQRHGRANMSTMQKWSVLRSLAVIVPVACLMGGIEAALIIALRTAKDKHLQWPLILMAILSTALLAAGVLRHYWDIYVHRTVRGISFLFVGIDAAGDVFSFVSVLFQPTLDVLGLIIYGTELILWIGVFACGGYYNLVPWARKRLANRTGGVVDNMTRSSSAMGTSHTLPPRETAEPISLHNLPSSTSVFRTPSGELDVLRERNTKIDEEERVTQGAA